MTEDEIAWDFSEIYSGVDDPKISKDMDDILKMAEDFLSVKGKIKFPEFSPWDS